MRVPEKKPEYSKLHRIKKLDRRVKKKPEYSKLHRIKKLDRRVNIKNAIRGTLFGLGILAALITVGSLLSFLGLNKSSAAVPPKPQIV